MHSLALRASILRWSGLLIFFREKTSAAHKHAAVARVAPFDADTVFELASIAGQLDADIAGSDGSAMQQSDTEPADFARHRRDRVAAAGGHFCRDREFQAVD